MTERHRRLLRPLCLGLVLLVAGCAGNKPQGSRGLARVAQTSEIRVGMSGEQPPLSMTARNGEPIGLDVALARVLAKSMGVDAVFVKMPFGRLLDALDDGEIDLVWSGMTITPERSRRVIFVGPYYTTGKSLLTRSEELALIEIPEDLDAPDLKFAALEGSTSETFARRTLSEAKLVLTEGLDEAVMMVVNGDVDALIADRETCEFGALRHPDAGLIVSGATFTIEPMGIAVPPDDPRFANMIQTYLTALLDTGALEKAQAFWFKDPSWVKSLR